MCPPLQCFSKRPGGEHQHQILVSFSCLQPKKGWVSWLLYLTRVLHSSQFSGGGKCITLNVNYSFLLHFPQTIALSFLEGPTLTARRPEGELMWYTWTSELWCSCSCVDLAGQSRLCAEGWSQINCRVKFSPQPFSTSWLLKVHPILRIRSVVSSLTQQLWNTVSSTV